MQKQHGLRKFTSYLVGIGCFTFIMVFSKITDPSAILMLGIAVAGINTPFVFGNIKEHGASIFNKVNQP